MSVNQAKLSWLNSLTVTAGIWGCNGIDREVKLTGASTTMILSGLTTNITILTGNDNIVPIRTRATRALAAA